MAQAPPKAGAKELLYSLQSKFDHEFTSLFRWRWFLQVCQKESLPTEIGKGRHWTSVFFCGCTSNAPRFAQGQPNGYIFSNERTWWNNWTERAEFNVPTCGKIASHQLCWERQPLWKSHDGLNVTCLDQCHGVRFHGTSTSQGWRKKSVVQSTV